MDIKTQIDILNAQLNGKTVEYYSTESFEWVPLQKGGHIFEFYSTRYRIKPMKKVLYQYLLQSDDDPSHFYSSYTFYESALQCLGANPNCRVVERLDYTRVEVPE